MEARTLKVSWPDFAPRPSDDDLKRTFSEFGTVVHCGVGTKKKSGLVVFGKAEDCAAAARGYRGPMTAQQLVDIEPATTPPRPTTPAHSYDPARLLKVSWPKDGARPTEQQLRAAFEQIAPVTNVGLGGGNAALVVFADADGMTKAGSSYDGPWRVAPARSASPRPPMPPTGREATAKRAPPPMQPPMGREVAVHNSAPGADDADLVKKHRRRAARGARGGRRRAGPRRRRGGARARLHDELGRQARSDEAARLAAPPPRPSPVYERVASKLGAARRDRDAALQEEAAMWRERALRAGRRPPPESPAVATMFQQHAARCGGGQGDHRGGS